MPKPPPIQSINTWIVRRGEIILGTTPDEMWAKAIASVNERKQSGVSIEYGPLEAAELRLREQRKARG